MAVPVVCLWHDADVAPGGGAQSLATPLPLRLARGQRAALASTHVPDAVPVAASRVLLGVTEWWARRASAAGLSGDWLDVEWAVAAPRPSLTTASAAAPADVQGTAEEVGQQYVSALSPSDRSRHGRHYTPTALAEELWAMTKRAMGWKRPRALDGLVLDPACGAGALLLPVLRDHMGCAARIDPQLALNALPNYIAGVDNDPGAAWLANVLLASEMLPILARMERARRRPLPALVRCGDGLAPVDQPARAVVMNPPYGRTRLDAAERERFAAAVYGHANLYGLFMAAGLEALDDDGVLAALVPTSFLAGRYFENLRGLLIKQAPLREVGFVADRSGSFTGVLQETALTTFTRRKARRVAVNSLQPKAVEVAVVASPRTSAPWLLPRRADDAPVAAAAQQLPLSLGGTGWRVSTGPLVWNRRKGDLGSDEGPGRVRVVWAADIDGGVMHQDPARDSLRWLTVRGTDEKFMVLREPAVLVQRTTAPEQTRRLVAAYLDEATLAAWGGAVAVENHVNVIRSDEDDPLVNGRTLTRLLGTDTLDRVLRCLSGSVAVSAYELAALPLPGADTLGELDALDNRAFERRVAAAYSPAQQ